MKIFWLTNIKELELPLIIYIFNYLYFFNNLFTINYYLNNHYFKYINIKKYR